MLKHDVPVLIPKNTTNSIWIWTAKSILFSCQIWFSPSRLAPRPTPSLTASPQRLPTCARSTARRAEPFGKQNSCVVDKSNIYKGCCMGSSKSIVFLCRRTNFLRSNLRCQQRFKQSFEFDNPKLQAILWMKLSISKTLFLWNPAYESRSKISRLLQ